MADSEVQDFVKGLFEKKIHIFHRNLTGNIHSQDPDHLLQGNPINHTQTFLFDSHKPLKKAYQDWLEAEGIKLALSGKHSRKSFEKEVKETINWIESGANKPIKINMLLDAPDYDFLSVHNIPLVVSERVLLYLQKNHKNEFESYIVEDINKKVKQKYYAINITNPDFLYEFNGDFKGIKDA